jgi:ATP-dependent DNA helicase RecG
MNHDGTKNRAVIILRYGLFARYPGINILVWRIEQMLECRKRCIIHGCEGGFCISAKNEVHFARAAPPCAKQKPLATRIKSGAGKSDAGHAWWLSRNGMKGNSAARMRVLLDQQATSVHCRIMRPAILNPLFAPITKLAGVGPRMAPLYDRLSGRGELGARVLDLLFHVPFNLIDRRLSPNLASALIDTIVTVAITIEDHKKPPRPTSPWRVLAGDETGDVTLVFFHARPGQIENLLPLGAKRIISGKLEIYDGMRQITQPDRIIDPGKGLPLPDFEPVYPLTEGLTQRVVAKTALHALEQLPLLPEWQDQAWLTKNAWPSFCEAITALHQVQSPLDLSDESRFLARLGYDEILASQIALQMIRATLRHNAGRMTEGDGRYGKAIRAALPFSLTGAQERAIAEIEKDMAAAQRMLRLVQGDVGSGKTLVAVMAMARAAEAGRQSAMMAPTEILARQHFERIAPLAQTAGLKVALLTGKLKAAEKRGVLSGLADGSIDIVVGTHALFQDNVVFADLALAVVDEQHRFGVHQRLALGRKGPGVDLLVMTATPIPRTLVLSYFGDMDVSVLDEKPPGRKPIDTRLVALDRLDEVIGSIGRAVDAGARIYWVCPLVAESEVLDVAAAEERARVLRNIFGSTVSLVHGRMSSAEKEEAVRSFATGETAILVATTVIEVGVDVPAATIMVIEHAERFGLAQLHQLRGRVGRGGDRSTCLLLYKSPLGETAEARLKIMRATEDGFRIAEEDLKLRGEGDLLGVKQSGVPGFRFARLGAHSALLAVARDDARLVLDRDPELSSPRGEAIRTLLYLFERDEAVRLIRSG